MAIVKSEKLGLENQNTQPTQIYTLLLAIWYWSPYPPPFLPSSKCGVTFLLLCDSMARSSRKGSFLNEDHHGPCK